MDTPRHHGSRFTVKCAVWTAVVCLVLSSTVNAGDIDASSVAQSDPTSTVTSAYATDTTSFFNQSDPTSIVTSPDVTDMTSSLTLSDPTSTAPSSVSSTVTPIELTVSTNEVTSGVDTTLGDVYESSVSPGTEETGTSASVTTENGTNPTDNPGSSSTESGVTDYSQSTDNASVSVSSVTSSMSTDSTDGSTGPDVTTEEISQGHTTNKVAIGVGTTFGIIGAVLIALGITYGVKRRQNPQSGMYANLNEPSVRFENPTYGVPNTNEGYSYD